MTLPDIWSRRKRLASGVQDIYSYDEIPHKVRMQLFLVMNTASASSLSLVSIWNSVVGVLREEVGSERLCNSRGDCSDEFKNWFIDHQYANVDRVLDGVEVWYSKVFAYEELGLLAKEFLQGRTERLNGRLKEAGIGYRLVGGQIVKTANEVLHEEAILPALDLLADQRFAAANAEFRKAFDEFRAGSYSDCLVDCCKALESVLKVVGAKRGWDIKETDPASKLINAAFANDFIPSFMQTQFGALKTLLESSVPTTRNKRGGHGAGNEVQEVPEHLAAFQLHQTASILVFLGECDRQA